MAVAAGALALAGDTAKAQAIIEDLSKRFPTDTLLNSVNLAAGRAAIEISRGNAPKALEFLVAARPYDRENLGIFYYRGLAHLRAKAGTEAAAEFQKILDHRTVGPFSPLHPLAHLGVARAAALAGDTAKSRKAYQDFLALWKDADPDVPILQEAKKEYAALK